jgi:hypothetical protein
MEHRVDFRMRFLLSNFSLLTILPCVLSCFYGQTNDKFIIHEYLIYV